MDMELGLTQTIAQIDAVLAEEEVGRRWDA